MSAGETTGHCNLVLSDAVSHGRGHLSIMLNPARSCEDTEGGQSLGYHKLLRWHGSPAVQYTEGGGGGVKGER